MFSARQVGRFRARPMAISAAVGYPCRRDSRRPRPLRPRPARPPWARPSGNLREISEAEALYFAGAALVRARFRRQIRAAVGRRLARPPRPEIRRRGRPEPAQPARGRGGAARRRRPRETRPGPRARGTSLRRLPDALRPRRSVPRRSGSPPSPPTSRRRSTRTGQGSSPPRSKNLARAAGRPRSPRPRPPRR